MNNLVNSVQLVGRIGQDVDFKELPAGQKMAKVSLATNEYYVKDGEKIQETLWHNIVAWGTLAEKVNTLFKKGKKVIIKGKLNHRSYENKSGNMQYITEIVVREFMLMS